MQEKYNYYFLHFFDKNNLSKLLKTLAVREKLIVLF